MADPLAIYGAIATSVDLLTKIYQAVKRYMNLPEALATAKSRMLTCQLALEKWRRDFRLNSDNIPPGYYRVLWGKEGSRQVFAILDRLDKYAKNVRKYVDQIVARAVKYTPTRNDTYGRQFQDQLEREARSSWRDYFSWKRFLGAVMDWSRKVNEDIASFNEDFKDLQRTSYDLINNLYGVDLERGGSFGDVLHNGIFYRHTRKHAESLHDAFQVTKPTTYLALEAFQMSSQQRSRTLFLRSPDNRRNTKVRDVDKDKDFQFLLKRDNSWTGAWFRFAKYNGRPSFCESFSEVLDYIALRGSCNLKTPEKSREQTFRVREYNDVFLRGFSSITPLKQQLRIMWPREKVQVAYAIASGFYRVVGSSWGDYFDCENIRAKAITTNEWAVALQAQPGGPRLSDVLDKAQMIHHRPGKKMLYHTQVYRLGVLLTEIALGRPAEVLALSKEYGPLLVTDVRGPRDATQIASEVIVIMGAWYGNAVYFCLSLFEKRQELKKDNLDGDFEQEVLLPLRNLYEASNLTIA